MLLHYPYTIRNVSQFHLNGVFKMHHKNIKKKKPKTKTDELNYNKKKSSCSVSEVRTVNKLCVWSLWLTLATWRFYYIFFIFILVWKWLGCISIMGSRKWKRNRAVFENLMVFVLMIHTILWIPFQWNCIMRPSIGYKI